MTNTANTLPEHIVAVRQFNRFHTRLVGALGERVLHSDYSLPQLRLLYEMAHAPAQAPASAAQLGRDLGMDPGYLSRLISSLEERGLVQREASPDHGKRLALRLTDEGRRVFAELESASAAEVAALLQPLNEADQARLVGAMAQVRRLLGDAQAPAKTFILRDPRPGDLGIVIQKQAELYAQEYGWDWTFEGLLAEIVGQYVKTFNPAREHCWIAESEGEVVGSVFVVQQDEHTAKLRMLYVDASARGLGLGRRLVDECLRFARAQGYRRMVLWTNDILVSARRIYQAAGFELVEEDPHHSFGKDLVGQVWARDL